MSKCQQPPEGWECSRVPGHSGPCAAYPVPAVPVDYHCNGFRHTYQGHDFVHGDGLCPEYPTCRSEAATLRALEEEMGDYTYDGKYAGVGTTGKRLLDPSEAAVDIMAQAKKLFDSSAPPVAIMDEGEKSLTDEPGTRTGRMSCAEPNLSNPILEVAAETEVPPPTTPLRQTFAVLGDVAEERQRQELKWGQQNHDNLMWNAILAEEVGESAEEVLTEIWGKEAGHGHGDLRAELVQVAAVAVAWIEALDRRA